MRGIGDPRAIAALGRWRGSAGDLAQKCFVRNSFSGAAGGGRGRGRGGVGGQIGAAPASSAQESDEQERIVGGLGRGAPVEVKQGRGEGFSEGVGEWREAVQKRILMDAQNRAGDGRGRAITADRPSHHEPDLGVRGIPFVAQQEVGIGIGRGRLVTADRPSNQELDPETRGIPFGVPQDVGMGRGLGRGKGIPVPLSSSAGRGRVIPALKSQVPGPVGRALPLGSFVEPEKVNTVESLSEEEFLKWESEQEIAPAAAPPTAAAPASPPKPFFPPQISMPLSLGRGRGQTGEGNVAPIGAEPPITQLSRESGRGSRLAQKPKAPRVQLSIEEARARAIAILEEGIEKNVAAEGERRRKGGMEKYADATEVFADRFKREPGQAPQMQRTRKERQRSTREGRPQRTRSTGEMSLVEPSIEEQITPEQEAELLRLDNESTFKENLHRLFLVQFEPEFAMEDFGTNPRLDEPPLLSLEEYLQSLKPMFLREDAGISEEQNWQEAIKGSLANAPQLEKLVEAYAGPGRLTASQQIERMQEIKEKLPPTAPPEVAAFTQRALLTLQHNPGLSFKQKERLMNNLVTGFSSV